MSKILLLLLCVNLVIHSTLAQCNQRTASPFFQRAVYDFTRNLVSRINHVTESHFIASGLSPWMLISALSMGATDVTLEEMKRVLKLHGHQCFNAKFFEMSKQLFSLTNDTMFEKSSWLFVDDKFPIADEYQWKLTKSGLCDIKNLPFEDAVSTAATINANVREATRYTIEEVVSPSDLDNVKIVLIDALYFKGEWKTPFAYENTEPAAFYNQKGTKIGDVNLMFVTGNFNLADINIIKATVLELPYGENSPYSMLIFLPFHEVSVSTVIDNLQYINLVSIYNTFQQSYFDRVNVQIPKFKTSSDINNMKDLLIDMGLRAMFDSGRASFDDIADTYDLYVSNFIQKARIEVSEEGTVASAVSEAQLESRMSPPEFVANKPFVYMIVERNIKIPLFVGAYSKPKMI